MEENRARSPKPGRGGVPHLIDHLLMINTLLDHERRLEIVEEKVNSLLRELSILDEVFSEQGSEVAKPEGGGQARGLSSRVFQVAGETE